MTQCFARRSAWHTNRREARRTLATTSDPLFRGFADPTRKRAWSRVLARRYPRAIVDAEYTRSIEFADELRRKFESPRRSTVTKRRASPRGVDRYVRARRAPRKPTRSSPLPPPRRLHPFAQWSSPSRGRNFSAPWREPSLSTAHGRSKRFQAS